MTKASDNEFPSLLVKEGTAPSSPASGDQRLFVDSSDHLLKLKNSSGTVTAVGSGMTNPMTTKGDIILGDTSGTPSRLAAGTSTYVLTSNGAAAFPSWQAPGGGGGSDLVQTNSGAGSVYVPGLRGSPDVKPASPNAKDDEFEALSGWTTLGSLDTSNVSDYPSHLHMVKNTSASQLDGIYKASPSTPFTVTVAISDQIHNAQFQYVGLMLLDATPTAIWTCGFFYVTSSTWYTGYYPWTNRTTRGTGTETANQPPMAATTSNLTGTIYLTMTVASASSVAWSDSATGFLSTTRASGINPGFTPANVGIFVSGNGGSVRAEAIFDWIRFS